MAKVDLIENISSLNIAENLDDTTINKIASRVKCGFETDKTSRKEWEDKTEEGIKIAEQIVEHKTYPWPGASNVKFPLIAISAIQFAARAYPSIVQGSNVVKAQVVGADPQGQKAARAKRVSEHMSWQVLNKMVGWDEDTDKLLHILPVVGTVFRKTYYSSLDMACTSELCMPLDVVIHMKAKNIDKVRRISHIIPLYKNEVIERERAGLFSGDASTYMQDSDEDLAEDFIEQHCWYDLDGDGYEEPYIVTIHRDSGTLVRIIARYEPKGIEYTDKEEIKRITPIQYFTPYFFIPGASGDFYALGFAHLLGPINESMNTVINQLLDAGHLANMQGGFLGRGIRLKGGALRFKPGEWKVVETGGGMLKDNIVPMPVREPSGVLFNLLGTLQDVGMKLASVSEAMAGETPSQNTPATTTLAVIEQGLKVFVAIYKRIYRSMTEEFKKIYRLNGIYTEPEEYFRVLDEQKIAFKEDYNLGDLDIEPVADPSLASEAQKLARVQALMQTLQINPSKTGQLEILRQYYEGVGAANIDKILPMQEIQQMMQAPPPPNPDALALQLDTVKAQNEEEIKRTKLPYELKRIEAEIAEIESRTMKNMAEAESKPILTALNGLRDEVNALQSEQKLEIERLKMGIAKEKQNGQPGQTGNSGQNPTGGAPGMAPGQNNPGGAELPGGMSEGLEGADIGGANSPVGLGGENIPADSGAVGGDQGTQPYPPDVERG